MNQKLKKMTKSKNKNKRSSLEACDFCLRPVFLKTLKKSKRYFLSKNIFKVKVFLRKT